MSERDPVRVPRAHPPIEEVGTLLALLESAAKSDPSVRSALTRVGEWLAELGAQRSPDAGGASPDAPLPPIAEPKPSPRVEPAIRGPRIATELSIGGATHAVVVPSGGASPDPAQAEPSDDTPTPRREPPPDLGLVARRARLKAECCRWAIERRKRVGEGADHQQEIAPTDGELAARLRALPDCFAWPLSPYVSLPSDRELDDAAGCYETLADAVEAVRELVDSPFVDEHRQRAYELLAESCSALLASLRDCGQDRDADQDAAFDWLRDRVFHERVYIARHMRLSDPADPSLWPQRQDAIAEMVREVDDRHELAKEQRNLLGKIGYISKRWETYRAHEREAEAGKLRDAALRLIELGVRPSDSRLRDALLPIADELPDGLGEGTPFALVLRAVDEYEARAESEPARSRPQGEPAPEVAQVRALVRGKVVVLIGGENRPESRERIERELGLRELRWITTRPHESISNFEAQVRREEVALVILAIRWSSHSFEDVKRVCDRYAKPYVRLPRGYGVNSVAAEIMAQASEALAR